LQKINYPKVEQRPGIEPEFYHYQEALIKGELTGYRRMALT
jgi:hypothetical protein